MPLVFEPPAADTPYFIKNFSMHVLPSLRIARAESFEFAYYYCSVNGVWRWVGLLNSNAIEPSGFTETESSAQIAIIDRYKALLKSCGLIESPKMVRRR